jgi:peptidoglycan/LPS O-acetylase OafA/YrhL
MVIKPKDTFALHLTFIDGMRGFAALYVVLHHAAQGANLNDTTPVFYLLTQGETMVAVFIAISGFCLMLPVTRNGLSFRGGEKFFYWKRAHRILPPYFVALGLGILAEVLSQPMGARLTYLVHPLTLLALLSHLFLFNNWISSVSYAFNGPLWSVAVECQIYLVFPLMIMAWKRFGVVRTLLGIFVLAHLLLYVSGHRGSINYYFIFALGMASAEVATHSRGRQLLPWSLLFGLVGYMLALRGSRQFVCDLFIGIFAASLMALLSTGKLIPIRKILSTRILVWLGSISYSLYLTHSVIQHIYLRTTLGVSLVSSPTKQFMVLLFGVTPVVLIVAYLFYLVAERPFLNHTKKQVVTVAVTETA